MAGVGVSTNRPTQTLSHWTICDCQPTLTSTPATTIVVLIGAKSMDELPATVADRRHSVNHLNQPRVAGEAERSAWSYSSPPTARLKRSERSGDVDCNRDVQVRGEVDVCAL